MCSHACECLNNMCLNLCVNDMCSLHARVKVKQTHTHSVQARLPAISASLHPICMRSKHNSGVTRISRSSDLPKSAQGHV